MNKITLGIIAVLALSGSFYGGMKYDQSKSLALTGSNTGTFSAQGRQAGFGGGNGTTTRGMRGAGGGTAGNIVSKDATSITVQMRDGGSRTVFFTAATPVLKSIAGSADDLKIGEMVTVMGTANSDGSVSAQSIQIRPATTTTSVVK